MQIGVDELMDIYQGWWHCFIWLQVLIWIVSLNGSLCNRISYSISTLHIYHYSSVLQCIGIIKVWDFLPENPTYNQLNINFVTAWQHWLGIVKPKNVLRSTLNHYIKLLWILKISYFTDFSADWLTDWLMPSDKHNSIMAIATGFISSLFNVASSRDVPFRQP